MYRRWTAAAVAFGITACAPSDTGRDYVGPLTGVLATSSCTLSNAKALARAYFGNDLRSRAIVAIEDAEVACGAMNDAVLTDRIMEVLAVVDAARLAGTSGSPADGSALANDLLPLATFACESAPVPCTLPLPIDLVPALSDGGAFGVRAGASDDPTAPIIALRSDGDLSHTWVLEPPPGGTWTQVVSERTLFYGWPPNGPVINPNETIISPNQFFWERTPDTDAFVTQPVVGVCLDPAALSNPTVLRIQTLLQDGALTSCATAASSSAAVDQAWSARLTRFATRLLGPTPLQAAAQRGLGVGGRPSDFSPFVAVNAVNSGVIEFLDQPTDGVVNTAFPIRVRAITDNGTPIENVTIQLFAERNNGKPVVISGALALTFENGGIASFPAVDINKPGGYRLRAVVLQDEGYQLIDGVSNRFNLRPR